MKRALFPAAAAAVLAAAPTASADNHGETVFRQVCATCHKANLTPRQMRNPETTLNGPPMNRLAGMLKRRLGSRRAFIRHVVDFTLNPAGDRALARPAVRRFGVMPPLSQIAPQLDKADVRAVAAWLWTRYEARPMPRHRGMGHGPRHGGPGTSMGMGMGR